MASGSEVGEASETQGGVSKTSAFHSSSATDSRKFDGIVNESIEKVVSALAENVERRLAAEPFRAKVARVDSTGIVINSGKISGMSVGDTFGVRKKRQVLTDPDTGLPLEAPGAPVGVIRVSEVNEKISFAQVIETAGMIERGDELEWLGMYEIIPQRVPGGR
jgi:hypothetical protein